MLEDMRHYVRMYDLVVNRMAIINDIMGYGSCVAAPCVVVDARVCHAEFCGRLVCKWRRWDVQGVERALDILTAVSRALWDARRIGFVHDVEIGNDKRI